MMVHGCSCVTNLRWKTFRLSWMVVAHGKEKETSPIGSIEVEKTENAPARQLPGLENRYRPQ